MEIVEEKEGYTRHTILSSIKSPFHPFETQTCQYIIIIVLYSAAKRNFGFSVIIVVF